MPNRDIKRRISATPVSEGAGVTVHRTIGTPTLRNLDPFLMLDHFGTDNPNDYIAGFPSHPHRGFITLTYMLDGEMRHEDSMGNRGNLSSGGVQWMKAASGVIHSEMPKQKDGLMRGFQLWINLPASEKMSAPAYQEFSAPAIPLTTVDNCQVKVISGSLNDAVGPVVDDITDLVYLDVAIQSAKTFSIPIDSTLSGFLYPYEGDVIINNQHIGSHQLVELSDGDSLTIKGGSHDAKVVIVAGKPIGEPIVQYGPFVMNSRQEIEQAMEDYHNGTLVQKKASWTTNA